MSKRHRKTKDFAPEGTGFDAEAFDHEQRAKTNAPRLRGKARGKAKRQNQKSAYYD